MGPLTHDALVFAAGFLACGGLVWWMGGFGKDEIRATTDDEILAEGGL